MKDRSVVDCRLARKSTGHRPSKLNRYPSTQVNSEGSAANLAVIDGPVRAEKYVALVGSTRIS